MTTATWHIYDHFMLAQNVGNELNLASGGDTVKVALITSAVAPNQAADTTFSGASYVEVTGTNYTAGGINVTSGQSCTLASDIVTFTSSVSLDWVQSLTGFSNAAYAVAYGSVSGKLIAYLPFGSSQGNISADFTITLPSGFWQASRTP